MDPKSFPLMNDERWLAFDVDGTLTESRKVICPDFKEWFMETVPMDRVVLVTGSDKEKTVEQVGLDFWSSCAKALQCCGNEMYKYGKRVTGSHWEPSEPLLQILNKELESSGYTERFGQHIEKRIGMLNFSVVGRGAVGDQRDRYAKYDRLTNERAAIAKRVSDATGLSAVCGGDTGIDIFPKGRDKSQALNWLYKNVSFFGDRCEEGGNDYALAKALQDENSDSTMDRYHEIYHVESPDHTFELLKALMERF